MHNAPGPKRFTPLMAHILTAVIYAAALLARLGSFGSPASEWSELQSALVALFFTAAFLTAWFCITALAVLDKALVRSESVQLPAAAIGIFAGAILFLMLPFIIGQAWPGAGAAAACAAGLSALKAWQDKAPNAVPTHHQESRLP